MRRRSSLRWLLALFAAIALLAAACSSDGGDGDGDGDAAEGAEEGDDGPQPAPPGVGPDVNGDGQVDIAILSPGDTNDGGFYQSFTDAAEEIADPEGWEVTVVDMIDPADAQEQARNACRQQPDIGLLAASELADAIPVFQEEVCQVEGEDFQIPWYVAGGEGVEQDPFFVQTTDDISQSQYLAGYATGLVMEAQGVTQAAFITGPELDFSVAAFTAFTVGVQSVIPDAEVTATYTGDFDDAAVNQEAATAALDGGAGYGYPYLGGGTDVVASAFADAGFFNTTPGTDRCDDDRFGVSSIFSPGVLLSGSLAEFAAGELVVGETRTFLVGIDPIPTALICENVDPDGSLQDQVDEVIDMIGSGELDPVAEIEGATG